jgi:hypothetical protein
MPERPVAPHDHTRFSRGGKLSTQAIIGLTTNPGASSGGTGGITDHGGLTGLADDDHTQYVELADDLAAPFIIDGGGSTITTGIKGDIEWAFAGHVRGVRMFADQSGSIVIDIWKDSYANFPPTVADTITASAKPTISSTTKSQDTTLTGWTTAFSAGDIYRLNVDSVTSITRVTLSITYDKT